MVQKYKKQKMCIKHDDVSQYKVFETLCSSNTNCKTKQILNWHLINNKKGAFNMALVEVVPTYMSKYVYNTVFAPQLSL